MRRIVVLLISAIGVSTSLAGPTTIAEWDLANAGNGVVTSLDLGNGITASDITYSGVNVLTGSVSAGVLVAQNWSTASTPDSGTYFEFTITTADGTTMTLDSLTLSLVRGNYGGGNGAESWQISASQDGFTTQVDLASLDISSSDYDEIVVFDDVDISALGTVTGTVTFRLYGYDYSTSTQDYSGLAYSHSDLTGQGVNLSVTGATHAIPVPSALFLSSLGLCLLSRFRRVRATPR